MQKKFTNTFAVCAYLCTIIMIPADELTCIASSEKQWTGVAVSKEGRVFTNFPKWSDKETISVAEIIDGKTHPYPSQDWNNRSNHQSFNAVQSVYIDDKDHLWVLDTHNPQFKGVQNQGPTLHLFDLSLNQRIRSYPFSQDTYQPDSYFNDVRVDTQHGFAYLTDSGNGALIVLNLKDGKARRILEDHPSVTSETNLLVCDGHVWKNAVDADGIALTPDRKHLYFIALTSHTLYRLSTEDIRNASISNEELAKKVEKVAIIPATDGMLFDKKGNLWLGALESNGVNVLTHTGQLVNYLKNPKISWADSFAEGPNGKIYFTTSQIHLPEPLRSTYQIYTFSPQVPSE
ncbi:SMP-30/gluconolactonase/LRE family protein [Rubritalea tangerina]|uniref:SMP-30/gluconolactonase/LRE family protein n=2 Tax=Rubritalea tangerina TaxID=430798 RepID=A0ABW4Z8X5_9BACT